MVEQDIDMDAAVKLIGKMQCPLGYKRDCMRVNKQCIAHHIEEKGEGKLPEEAKKTSRTR